MVLGKAKSDPVKTGPTRPMAPTLHYNFFSFIDNEICILNITITIKLLKIYKVVYNAISIIGPLRGGRYTERGYTVVQHNLK